ncbi:MAG: methyltransferase domain-containing protein [Pseudomonadota bacterium]
MATTVMEKRTARFPSLVRAFKSVNYAAQQYGRMGFYLANYMAGARVGGRMPEGTFDAPDGETKIKGPGWPALLADAQGLMRRERRAMARGDYEYPENGLQPLKTFMKVADYLRDTAVVGDRRRAAQHQEVFASLVAERERYPRYYLQNFHYQSDGYFSKASAKRYDFQVDVLFTGVADAMRRRARPWLNEVLRTPKQARLTHADFACGTGRFLGELARNYPDASLIGVDLSPAYLDLAAKELPKRNGIRLIHANMEATPLDTASLDSATVIFAFHELPKKARSNAVKELSRVLKPGGRLVIVDTLQLGDHAAYDGLLHVFPKGFHEPYYAEYVASDQDGLMAKHGLQKAGQERAFLSKVSVYDKMLEIGSSVPKP